uniref:Ig-like domain-containing protein n=1 Tax=Gadus morhua TaxID=8049 RepID=A0A8C5BP91_GADMO
MHLKRSKVNDRYLGFVPQPHLLFLFLGSSLCLGEALNVRALVGDDVTLSVDTKTSSDIGENVMEWSRTDLNPDIVHRHENRRTIYEHQNPAYRGRTMLSAEDLDRGIISLKLSDVRLADEGNYTCLFKSTENMYSPTNVLPPGAASSPFITLEEVKGEVLVLGCRAKGWYPQPKLSWWNAEGALLPAVTMPANQEEDRLYNISSTLVVERTNHLPARCSKVNDRYLGCVPQPHLLFLFLGSSLCLGEALNVRALVGDDVTLSVDTQTSSDISEAIVEWSRTDLNPDIVHRHENRRTIYEHQNPAYRGRTMLSAEDLDRGIISLKLSNVRLADEGNYTCLFKSTENMYSVHLLPTNVLPPGAASSPVITLEEVKGEVLVLGCRAKGWYPQPKLSWWTTEGALLPAVTMVIADYQLKSFFGHLIHDSTFTVLGWLHIS